MLLLLLSVEKNTERKSFKAWQQLDVKEDNIMPLGGKIKYMKPKKKKAAKKKKKKTSRYGS